jgi:hypothetical protein
MLTRARQVVQTSTVRWSVRDSAIPHLIRRRPFQQFGLNNVLVVGTLNKQNEFQFCR